MQYWLLWATAAIWIAFVVYWNVEAVRAASAPKAAAPDAPKPEARESPASRRTHERLLWSALFLALLPWFWPLNIRFLPSAPWIAPTGLAIQLAFASLYIQAKRHLGRYWAGTIRTTSDHKLIRTGPYRRLRHPMYTALIGMFVGTAIVWGQLHALLGLAVGTIAYTRKIRLEERHLSTNLGPDYDAYRRQTWALIPGLF